LHCVDLNIVRYAAMVLAAAEKNGQTVVCEYGYMPICGEPAEYLVPDATRPGGAGQDIEQRPAMFRGSISRRCWATFQRNSRTFGVSKGRASSLERHGWILPISLRLMTWRYRGA
jgi:hypothetical protein